MQHSLCRRISVVCMAPRFCERPDLPLPLAEPFRDDWRHYPSDGGEVPGLRGPGSLARMDGYVIPGRASGVSHPDSPPPEFCLSLMSTLSRPVVNP